MIPEHQLLGMRGKKNLPHQILDLVLTNVVPQERDGHNQRNQASPVLVHNLGEFHPRWGIQVFLQVPSRMLQNV